MNVCWFRWPLVSLLFAIWLIAAPVSFVLGRLGLGAGAIATWAMSSIAKLRKRGQ